MAASSSCVRIRSAQLGECQPCMQSRKHDSITDEDVACLIAPGAADLTEQERLAVEFLDLLSADHHAIDDEFYRELGEVFTAAQIIELGFACANSMGLHRFIHTLDVFGNERAGDPLQRRPGRLGHADVAEQALGVSQTVLVTGATGLAGANICKLLIERGDHVRALARTGADTEPLAALGVEVVTGDITEADDVLRAAKGSDSAIHCAALLGGASQNLADFEAVNIGGHQERPRCGRGRRPAPGGGGQHRHLLRHRQRARPRGCTGHQGTEFGSVHHHQDGGLPGRHGPGRGRSGRGQHPPGRHLRPLAGGQQRAGHDQLQPGAPVGPAPGASSAT